MVQIRFSTTEDAERIADISRRTFYDSFASDNTVGDMDKFMNEKFTKEALMKEVGAPGNIFFMATEGEEILGYVRMRDDKSAPELSGKKVIELARIYVVANVIGKGIGKMLMEKCIDIGREMKKEIIWLGVWEKNQRAIDFYTQWGFEKFGTHIFLLGDDPQNDWLMKKEL